MNRFGAQDDRGFTIVEALVAVTILAVAIVLTIQPILASLSRMSDARAISVAENLAQAEVESIRALNYDDVGLPGYTPDGVLTDSQTLAIEGHQFMIQTEVEYAGSLTGLSVVPQGGDGVQGAWDPGVDYKVVIVTVTASGREADPVIMETIIAPPNIGAHEGIANARVTIAPHEPFAPSTFQPPSLKVHASPAAPIKSGSRESVQVFPAIAPATYTVLLDIDDGWIIHPDDVTAGLDRIAVTAGNLADTTIRVYKAGSLAVAVTDSETGLPITDARVTLVHVPSATQTDYAPGEFTIPGLIPDAYDITVWATGYDNYGALSVDLPSGYPGDLIHELAVALVPSAGGGPPGGGPPGGGSVSVTFTVTDNTNRPINGATVTVPHPTAGTLTAVTNASGVALMDLDSGTTFSATGSTPWGHGDTTASFDPGVTAAVSLKLTRPSNRGTMVLKGGSEAEFWWRPSGGSWRAMPSNVNGEASFVRPQGWHRVGKRCESTGAYLGFKWVYVGANQNRSTTISGFCP